MRRSFPNKFKPQSQQDVIRLEIDNAIKRVLDHGHYIMGPEVREFENILKNFFLQNMSLLVQMELMH